MKSYVLYFIISLLFCFSGIMSIISSNIGRGGCFVALGCCFGVIALNKKKENNQNKDK